MPHTTRRSASAKRARRRPATALAIALAVPLFMFLAAPAHATFSIVARDPDTGQLGAAVQSHWFSVGHVIWVEPGVGAVATQSLADFTYGPAGLELLRLGRSAKQTLEGLIASDSAPFYRQVAILDFDGDVVAHSGEKCIAEFGHIVDEHFSVQANLMAKDTVPAAMAKAFREAEGPLAERLVSALEAAQAEGGDIRGKQSAAILVTASDHSTGRPWADFEVDLRIEDHAEPIRELRRLLQLSRAYEAMNRGDLAIEDGDFEAAEREYGQAVKFAPGNPEPMFWYAISLANAGAVDEAEKLLARVYAMDPAWRELPARLVPPELITDPEIVPRLTAAK